MSQAIQVQEPDRNVYIADAQKHRRAEQGYDPSCLASIYQEEVNIAIWQREFAPSLIESTSRFINANPGFQASFTTSPNCALASLRKIFGVADQAELCEDIAELVEMFAYLFELERVGLRLATLDRAMCPRFHVDKVPCRLVATYHGVATEWLPHQSVNRSKLGVASHGIADADSGVYLNSHDVQQLNSGDVALLKGELWDGNENAGLVHRSPAVAGDDNRLLLTLDFCN